MTISIICVYNKPDVFQNILKKSLAEQDYPYELIGVDNSSGQYSSAAKALNYGASQAKGDIYIFVHQDVSFEETDSLRRLFEIFMNNTIVGDIVGIVGIGYDENGQPRIIAGSHADFLGEKVGSKGFQEDFTYAESVDEFLLIMKRETFDRHSFNERACNGWRFYAVEQCMNARSKGHNVYVINADIKHHSPGKIDSGFYWARFRLSLYHPFYGRVITTCCDFYTHDILRSFLAAIRATLYEH